MTVPPTVVLVDDSEDLRMLVRMQVERSGHLAVVAEGSSGVEAIDLARRHRPDLMLLDVSMPVMDGLEALPQVRDVSPGTKVVMFTGFAEQGLGDRARELGAVALLEKSVSVRALPERLVTLTTAAPAPSAVAARTSSAEAAATSTPADESSARPGLASVLDEHQERFREVFEEAAIGMGTMTLAGHLVRVNKAMAALIDQSDTSLVGLGYERLLPEQERFAFFDLLTRATCGSGQVVQFEHGLTGLEDRRRIRTTLAPICDSQGTPLYLFVQLQDVSEQRAAEAALRQSEERFRLLIETVTDYAIFMLDPEGNVRSWNAGAQRMKGYSGQEIIGRHFRTFYPPEQQRQAHPEHELRLALRDGRYEEEGWRVRKDGSRFWANVVITALHDPSGVHVGFAKITRDVTERRLLQDEREATAAALETANDELTRANTRLARAADDQAQFLAVTAHELKTPIAVLEASAEMLQQDPEIEPRQQTQLLNAMVANTSRLGRLLDDLLTAARLDAQAIVLDPRPVALRAIMSQSVEAAARRNPDKSVTLAPTAPELSVVADAERLGQILDNLVNNAVNHGLAPVEVTAVRVGDQVEIQVTDHGAGVPAELQGRLFDRYVTAARSGTGLGLFIVRELARAHGGDAVYRPGDRPTFVVTLPAADGPAA